MSREKKNQNASKRGTIETSSLRFARSKPQKTSPYGQSRSARAPKTSPYGHLAKLVPQKLNANNKAPRFARRLKNTQKTDE